MQHFTESYHQDAALLYPRCQDTNEDDAAAPEADRSDFPSAQLSIEGDDFGDYLIVRCVEDGSRLELGRGSMGVTYRAIDTTLDRAVALKVLVSDLALQPEPQARFLREARVAARLRHPHIAGVFQFGVSPRGECFYAMELVEGENLEERVRRDGPLPVEFCLALAEQVADALLAAEQGGIVHRDLKPANLMLQERGGGADLPWVKVIDFGLAKAVVAPTGSPSVSLTQGYFLGTPGFASPEQFDASAPLDTRSDIFSLGVTLWFALTGNLAFIGKSLTEIHARQAAGQIPRHHLTDAAIPQPVISLLEEMLMPDLTHRPQTARVLRERLQQCRLALAAASSTEVAQVAPSPARRKRALAVWVGAGLVLACVLLAGFLVRTSTAPRQPPLVPVAPIEKSIAVLPFENVNADNENSRFAEGMQNDLITTLGRISELRVINRVSVSSYANRITGRDNLRETAAELRVSYLLAGSVQRAGNRVRMNVRLIQAHDGQTVWSQGYDRELVDLFAVQDELTEKISQELRVRITSAERKAIQTSSTLDVAAYDLDLRARQLLDAFHDTYQGQQMMPEAIRLLGAATERDPGFLRGWCDLVRAHMALYWYGFDRTPERLAQAARALDMAVRLNPDAGETHLMQAEYYYYGFRDYGRARTELALARLTLPNDATIPFLTACIDRRQGRWETSDLNYRRALELDPRNTDVYINLAVNYGYEKRYDEMEGVLREALAITPGASDARRIMNHLPFEARADVQTMEQKMRAMLQQDPSNQEEIAGFFMEAAWCQRDLAAARRALDLLPSGGIPLHGVSMPPAWYEGLTETFLGDSDRARTAFLKARAIIEPIATARPDFARAQSVLGMIDAYLGRSEQAIAEGRRAVALLPVAEDGIEGPELLIDLATIYTAVGKADEAIAQLEAVARIPSGLSYGTLRLNPKWDSLRGKPRFEALVRQFAPKHLDGERAQHP